MTLHAQDVTSNLSAECGGPTISNAYGPYDYTNSQHVANKLPIVERAHFTAVVESLKAGATGVLPGGDIDYTLRAFPNHHRALDAMGRYHLQYPNTLRPPGASWSADCYFKRALAFRPKDWTVHMIYGIYLVREGRKNEAEHFYLEAIELQPGSAEAHHNLSLLYIELKKYELARDHAAKAYELGFPLRGAESKLRRLGEWFDE
jgi:tetratricopeptide (TPR) repeat protein